jgi:tetratricopeptide (TPR) repeat protein
MSTAVPIPSTLAAALADRFPIERQLGEGGMATVYLARDLRHARPVALKVLRPEVGVLLGRVRFEQEIRVASSLSHPHIIPVFDSGEAAGFLYYVMPVMEGESLASRIARERFVAVDEAVRILAEVADALDIAHAQGIVHRDIKPGNILLSGGHAQVADFGIALALRHVEGDRLTATGLSIGTPAYMSPEQAVGTRTVDGKSDQYSLACVFYEMLGGDPPFTGSTPRSVMARHVSDTPPPLATLRPGLPPGVEVAVQRALSKIPVDRYPTCAAFASAVQAAVTGAPAPAVSRWRFSRRAAMIGVAVLALAATGWGVNRYWPRGERMDSVALLPPENGTRDSALQYRVDGVYEQLVTSLAQAPRLQLKPRTAVAPYWQNRSIADVVRGLAVRGVLETTVFPSADSVRIVSRLVRASTQAIEAAQDTSVPWREVNRAVAATARRVADAAGARFSKTAATSLAHARIVDPRAYDYLQKAKYAQGNLGMQRVWLDSALSIDPTYGDAYAELANILRELTRDGTATPAEVSAQTLEAARRAVRLDSSSVKAWQALAGVELFVNFDIPAANRALDRVRALGGKPLPDVLLVTGRFDEAIAIYDQDAKDDPLSSLASLNRCWSRILSHRFREALPFCRRMEQSFHDDNAKVWSHLEAAWAFARLGMGDSAIAEVRRSDVKVDGPDPDFPGAGFVYSASGRNDLVQRILAKRNRRPPPSPRDDPFNLALGFAGTGNDSLALDYIERAYRERWPDFMYAWADPLMPERVRRLPRYQALLRAVGFPAEPADSLAYRRT